MDWNIEKLQETHWVKVYQNVQNNYTTKAEMGDFGMSENENFS